jgi:hypothetical protein
MLNKTTTALTMTAALAVGAAVLAPTIASAGYPMCIEQPGSDACKKEAAFGAVKNGLKAPSPQGQTAAAAPAGKASRTALHQAPSHKAGS